MTRFLLAVMVLGAACGESAVEKCDDLADTVCDRVVDCYPNGLTHAQCVEGELTTLRCFAATDVLRDYGTCISELESASCMVLFPRNQLLLPLPCRGVIVTE